MNDVLWQPDAGRAAATRIARFARERGFDGPNAVDGLWRWSVEEPAAFWQGVWDLAGVKASRLADTVLADCRRDAGCPLVRGGAAELCREPAAP